MSNIEERRAIERMKMREGERRYFYETGVKSFIVDNNRVPTGVEQQEIWKRASKLAERNYTLRLLDE